MTTALVAATFRGADRVAIAGLSSTALAIGSTGINVPGLAGGPSLLTLVFALLAGAAAFLRDDPASAITDVAPTTGRRVAAPPAGCCWLCR